jgi:hypothetical protein
MSQGTNVDAPVNCEQYQESISQLLDRELDAASLSALYSHFSGCPACSRACALLCCAEAAALPSPLSPSDQWERIESALPVEQPGRRTAAPSVGSGILTAEEAAAYLRLGTEELLTSLEGVPHFYVGPHLRFRKAVLEEWIAVQEATVMPPDEKAKTANRGQRLHRTGSDIVVGRPRITRLGRT